MAERSYEFTGIEKVNAWGITVRQIRATRDIPRHGVKAGEVGGWVESADLPSGGARIFGDAQIDRAWQCLVVGPIGSENVYATLYRTANGRHRLHVGCWEGTLGTLMAEVKRRRLRWTADEATQELWVAQYRALRRLGRATVVRWAEAEGQ